MSNYEFKQRALAFRAWDAKYKMMTYSRGLGYFFKECEADILMQWTGLVDKTGRDIYEGDILETENDGSDGCDVWPASENGTAIISIDEHGVHLIEGQMCRWDWDNKDSIYSLQYMRVIGNVFENPELIPQ